MSAISRVSGVQPSGLEIVKKRRRKPANLATQNDYAAIDFKPWVRDADNREILPADVMKAITINSRLAYAVMLRSKPQLIEMHETLDVEAIDELMAGLAETGERLKELAQMVEAAYVRVLASACAAVSKR